MSDPLIFRAEVSYNFRRPGERRVRPNVITEFIDVPRAVDGSRGAVATHAAIQRHMVGQIPPDAFDVRCSIEMLAPGELES